MWSPRKTVAPAAVAKHHSHGASQTVIHSHVHSHHVHSHSHHSSHAQSYALQAGTDRPGTPSKGNDSPGATVRTPPRSMCSAKGPTTPTTPQRSPAADAFITSSPRTKKQSKINKLRGIQSASKMMFSPPYNKKSLTPPPNEPCPMEMSPVKQSLQRNLALHGHKEQRFDEYDEDEFDPWRFIAALPRIPANRTVSVCLPPKTCRRMTLVLDLDETLVHCSTDPGEIKRPHFQFDVEFNNQIYKVTAKKRPGFDEFLEYVKDKFETVIFTASQRVYANKLLDLVDPNRESIQYRVFRDDCVNVDGNYLKDLTVLGRDLKRTVIIDNSPQAFSYQLDNGLPILSWFDSEDDTELYKVIPLLDKLAAAEDVRPILRNRFKLHKKVLAKAKDIAW